MNDLLKALRHFITRDLVFVIAGAIATAAFLYRFDRLSLGHLGIAALLLAGGVSYVVGYALEAAFSLLRIVTTEQLRTPGAGTRWLFHWLTGEVWTNVPGNIDRPAVRATLSELELARIERVVMLKQLCASVGPGSVVAAGMVFWRYRARGEPFDLYLSIAAMFIGLVLIPLARLKAAQEAKCYERSPEHGKERAV